MATPKLYVANSCRPDVTVHPVGSTGNVIPSLVHSALGNPTGIAIDPTGKVYVENSCNHTITVFAGSRGNVLPTSTIGGEKADLVLAVGSIAVDFSGHIAVTKRMTQLRSIPPAAPAM